MNNKFSVARLYLLAITFVVGAVIGYCVADWVWQGTHPRGLGRWVVPRLDLSYTLMKAGFSLGMGVFGVALAGFDLLPKDDVVEKS